MHECECMLGELRYLNEEEKNTLTQWHRHKTLQRKRKRVREIITQLIFMTYRFVRFASQAASHVTECETIHWMQHCLRCWKYKNKTNERRRDEEKSLKQWIVSDNFDAFHAHRCRWWWWWCWCTSLHVMQLNSWLIRIRCLRGAAVAIVAVATLYVFCCCCMCDVRSLSFMLSNVVATFFLLYCEVIHETASQTDHPWCFMYCRATAGCSVSLPLSL